MYDFDVNVFIFILTIHIFSVLNIVMNASDIVIYQCKKKNQLESVILLYYIERCGNLLNFRYHNFILTNVTLCYTCHIFKFKTK